MLNADIAPQPPRMSARRMVASAAMFWPACFAASCGRAADEGASAEKLRVFVSIPPQAHFVERVGGAYVDVEVLVASGGSPHSFDPTPRQMAKLSRARIYFAIGVPFEQRFLPRTIRTSG